MTKADVIAWLADMPDDCEILVGSMDDGYGEPATMRRVLGVGDDASPHYVVIFP